MLGGEPLPAEGVVIALLGAAGSGAAYTLLRKLSNEEHPSVIILYFPMVCLPATIIFWLAIVHNAQRLGLGPACRDWRFHSDRSDRPDSWRRSYHRGESHRL